MQIIGDTLPIRVTSPSRVQSNQQLLQIEEVLCLMYNMGYLSLISLSLFHMGSFG